ncbi:hypothetical protein BFJ72_g3815 [Fusarium proliferatum]|uniref:DUF8213 domain-containing protein n=1 Tax=Gibberella intermedia TaxID=948311 RepID=A0A420TRE5_GIBIN|nr:hypothetical protein BFJ72_g3815 [Fusarium proliferatum]
MLGSLVVLLLANLSIASPTLEKRAITCLKVGQTATASWTNSAGKKCTFTGVVGSNYGANPSGSGDYSCNGRCGAGCSGTAIGNVYTQDCFSHDICSLRKLCILSMPSTQCDAQVQAQDSDTSRRAQWVAISKHQAELSDIWGRLEHHPSYNGVFSLSKDGILRSLGPDRDVHDAVPLSPHLIKALLDRLPFRPENEIDFRGVDGRNTPKEQWYHPDKGLLPPPLVQTEEQRKLIESKRDETRRRLEEAKTRPRCPPQIMSDHDLGFKESSSEDVS